MSHAKEPSAGELPRVNPATSYLQTKLMANPANRELDNGARAEVIAELRRGRPLGEVAREHGVPVADLCRWIAETVTVLESATLESADPDDEIRRLRLENECLRKQRDFYRKAAGIISTGPLRTGVSDALSRGGDLI